MIESMTIAEYAAYQREMGERVVESGGVYWRRVRPFFYRPLVPWQALDPALVKPPRAAVLGGWQCVVNDNHPANSRIAFLVFPEARGYSVDSLDKKRRWEVHTAMKHFEVRAFGHADELKSAYEVYLDFQSRTGYEYRADRVRRESFDAWAESVFRHPKVLVLGAFMAGRIEAVSICQVVEDILIYASFFSRGTALAFHVGSLMLHSARAMAAAAGCIRQVFAGLRKSGRAMSVDDFYLQRGFQVVVEPSYCRLHPVAGLFLRVLSPGRLEQILGTIWEDGTDVPRPAAAAARSVAAEILKS